MNNICVNQQKNIYSGWFFIKYLTVTFLIVFFIIFYVWQNVEVMKIKMEHQRSMTRTKELIKQNCRLKFKIEKLNRIAVIEKYAKESGMRHLTPDDFETIVIQKNAKKEY